MRGALLSGPSIVTGDFDQADEACSASSVLPSWGVVANAYRARHRTSTVFVRKGRREFTRPAPDGAFGRGWWALRLDVLARALGAYAWVTFVTVCKITYLMKGLAIGGRVSTASLATVLTAREAPEVAAAALGDFPFGVLPFFAYVAVVVMRTTSSVSRGVSAAIASS